MWWLRRIDTAQVPLRRARSLAICRPRRTSHGPGSRLPSQVTRRGEVGDHLGLAGAGHLLLVDVVEVRGQQGKPMRGVPEQIALDQHLGGGARLVVVQPGAAEQGGGKLDELAGTVAIGHGPGD